MRQFAAQFDDGASRFMTQSNLQKYGPAQADGTAFVMTRKQADKLLADAGGDAAKFEQALGLPANTLSTNPMVRVDFPRPRELNVRVPRGTEAGANSLWMPGGYLPSGQLEAVLDLGAAKPGACTTTPVVTGAKGKSVVAAGAESSSAAFGGTLYPSDKLRKLVPYLEKRGVSVYGTNGNPRFDARWDGTGTMYLPESPTVLQIKHELSHYLDFKQHKEVR